jgi:mono/diheme cytochrome c family protein
MPAWKGKLSPDDITALVTLLRSWQQGAATTTTAPATATTSGAEQALLARAAAVFSANCQTCHGADGVGGIGPPLKPSDLIPTLTDAQVRAIIENGSPGTVMPAWKGKLSPDDITAAVALLRSWQQTTSTSAVGGATAPSAATTAISAGPTTATASPTTAAPATASTLPATTATTSGADQALIAKGAAVFSANCQPCHGAEGVGGIGPKLKPNAFVGRSADAQVRQTIENGRPGTPMPAWKGKLAPGDITAALALLRSWQQTTTTGSGGPTTVPGGGSTTVPGGGPPATTAAAGYATIPFTHRPHMEKGGMSCLFCHAQARRGPSADLPPLQLCAGCHRWLTVQTASTKAVVAAYDSGAQVSWPRVYKEPDFVFFTHQVHVELAKLECSNCHGNVAAMGLAREVSQLNMKFCIDCHKKQTDLSFLMNCEICHK